MITTRLMTVDDLDVMGEKGERLELFDGVPVEHLGVSMRHGYLGFEIGLSLGVFVKRHRPGRFFSSDTQFTLARNPDTVVKPDLSFIREERMPPVEEHDRISRIAPDFAVEVISPTDRMGDVIAKVGRYQAAGVPLVWVVDPVARTVAVYELGQEPRTLGEGEMLDGGEVFPGFTLAVAGIFA